MCLVYDDPMDLDQHIEIFDSAVSRNSGLVLTRCVLAVTNGAFELSLATVDHCQSGVRWCNRPKLIAAQIKTYRIIILRLYRHIKPKHTKQTFEKSRYSGILQRLLSALQ